MHAKRIVLGATLLGWAAATLWAAPVTVVSSASYAPTVAPDSLATVYGSGLAASTAQGAPDAGGNLPLELAGVRVEINGRAAQLAFVSPGQINLVIPALTETGTAQVTVKSSGAQTASGAVQVALTAPAVFSADGSGSGEAAALNAVTFARGPFAVLTEANGGADKRTRVAIYCTGVRYAGNPSRDQTKNNVAASLLAVVAPHNGDALSTTVEYAGPAPGFPGLDQVNLVLPIEAAASSSLEFVIAVQSALSRVLTLPLARNTSLPGSGLTVSPAGGFEITGVAGALTPGSTVARYTLGNTSRETLSYSVRSDVSWLSLSTVSGVLAPGAATTVAVSLAAAITRMEPQLAMGSIDFSGGGVIFTRNAALTIQAASPATPSACEQVTAPTSYSLRMVNDRSDTKTIYIGNVRSSSGSLIGVVGIGFEMNPKTCQIVGLPRAATYEVEVPVYSNNNLNLVFDGSAGFLVGGKRYYSLRMAPAGGCGAADQFAGQAAYSVCF
jgi:uncharacterized protein (TIGR03437 family)